MMTTRQYDRLNRLRGITAYAESFDGQGQRVKTTTLAAYIPRRHSERN